MVPAVVIVNYRTPELVADCIAAVDVEADVVVVDNASGDGSVERLGDLARVVARPANDGFAAGVNAGFAATQADVVLLLNPDTRATPGALPALMDYLDAHPRCGVVAPALVGEDGAAQRNAYQRFPSPWSVFLDLCAPLALVLDGLRREPPLHDGAHVAHVTGAALAIRRAAFDAAGPFDEGYFLYFEETEWQQRVGQAGWSIDALPSVSVVHLVRGGDGGDLAPSVHFARSARRWLTTHGMPAWAARAWTDAAILLSRVGLRALALLMPGRRAVHLGRARGYDAVWRAR